MPEEIIQWDKLTVEEKDMLIHTRVMGLHPELCTDGQLDSYMGSYWGCTCGWVSTFHLGEDKSTEHNKPIPRYSQSMDAAWVVLQKVAARWDEKAEYLDEIFYQFQHELLQDAGGEIWTSYELMARMAKWTPETVCIAALKAVGCTFAEDKEE